MPVPGPIPIPGPIPTIPAISADPRPIPGPGAYKFNNPARGDLELVFGAYIVAAASTAAKRALSVSCRTPRGRFLSRDEEVLLVCVHLALPGVGSSPVPGPYPCTPISGHKP